MTASKIDRNSNITETLLSSFGTHVQSYIGRRLCGMLPMKSLTEKVVYSFTETIETNSSIFLGV